MNDIELPPLPHIEVPYLVCNPQRADILKLCHWCEDIANSHARAAVEADRHRGSKPVAWFTEDHLTDKSATTWDAKAAQRWREKGWPVNCLYDAPQPTEPVRMPSDDERGTSDPIAGLPRAPS